MIYTLTDRDYNPLDAIEVSTGLIGQYISSIIETLDLTIPTGTPNWVEGNYIFCQDAARRNYWFNISKREESLNGHEIKLTCYSGSLDVLSESAPEIKTETAQTLQWYFNQLYMDTGITLGINDFTTRKEIVSVEISQSTAEATNTILQAFGAEGRFDAEIVQCVPKSLTLNVYSRIGQVESQALLSDEDASLTKLDYTSDLSNLATAIKPYGKTGDNDQAVSLTDKLYEYKDAAGKVLYNSPKGSPFIFSVEGHEKYFVKLKAKSEAEGYILKRYSGDEDTPDKLWANALALLKTLDHAKVTYSMAGFATCELGDTVTVEVQSMSDLIIISARVTELRFNDDDPAKNEYVFSNYKELSTNIESIDKLVARIASQVTDLSSKTKTFVTTDTIVPIQDAVEKAQTTADNANAAVDELSKVAVVQGTFDKMQEAIAKSLTDQAALAQANLDAAKAELQKLADDANLAVQAKYDEYVAETAETAKAIADAKAQADSALSTADGTKLTVDEQAKKIESVVATSEANTKAVTKAQQTADGLTATVATAQETADGAVTKATTAQQTADGLNVAITKAQEAADGLATDITTISAKVGKVEIAVADAATKAELKVESDKITIGVKDAKDYADGAVSKVEVHTAWAWSADGTDRFTTVYPGENLFLNSGSNSGKTTITGGIPSVYGTYSRTDSYEQITPPSSNEYFYRFTNPSSPSSINNLWGLVAGGTYTISGQAVINEGTLAFRAQAHNGTNWYNFFGESAYDLKATNSDGVTYTSFSYTFTVPTGATGIYLSLQAYNYTTNTVFRFKKMKLEKGDATTIYTPAPSEDPVNAYPHYVGTSLKGSDNPADYTWQLDPAYLSIMSEMALQGKLDNDSFYEALDGKVNVEDFLETQQLADTLQNTINAFIQETFANAVSELEQRDVGLAAELGSRIAEFSFLKTYMKMGEEGFVIGSDDSRMKMLLGNGKLSFIDGGATVAYFSNQAFYINRGIIVDGVQVSTHKWVRLNDEHTIFAYVGG